MSLLGKLTAKPWEHTGEMHGPHGAVGTRFSPGQVGLTGFLAVVTSLFALFMVSYYSRTLFPDWEMLAEPQILWLNTALLVLASVTIQLASGAARRNAIPALRKWVAAAAVLTLAFIAGQWLAWNQLADAGYFARSNPAVAFFYLLTAVHALHMAGGLWYLGRVGYKISRKHDMEQVLPQVALSATYWHYLLLVWLAIFVLLLRT